MYQVQDGKIILKHGKVDKAIIAVTSGKGGVGKSTVTSNLALALTQLGNQVGIIDADVYGFSIPQVLGLKDKPTPAGLEGEMYPPMVHGVKVMSVGSFVDENEAVIWRAPLLGGVLQQFMEKVHWQELDYLLFDLPPGTGDMPLNILQRIPDCQVLLVTTPQTAATQVAGRVGRMAKSLNVKLAGIVENMSYYSCPDCDRKDYLFGKGGAKALAARLGIPLLAELPLVSQLREGADRGEPLITLGDSLARQTFLDLAAKLDKPATE